MKIIIVFLFFLSAVSGHVRLRYSYENNGPAWPIRNAPSSQSDGSFSTSGPCGGNLEWGANGFVQINNGQEIDLRISYNGGHQSANNAFHVAFKCADTDPSELTQDIFNNGAYTVAKTGCQNIAATDSRVNPPYELSCTLDREQRADTEDVFCTIAVIDQRNWGGCIDVKITPDAAPTPGEGSSSTLDEFYLVNEIVDTSPPDSTCCKFTKATLDVGSISGGKVKVRAGAETDCADMPLWETNFELNEEALTYTNGQSGTKYANSDITIGSETFEFNLINSVLTSTNQIGGGASPVMCDAVFRAESSSACSGGDCLISFFKADSCSGNGGALAGALIGLSVVIVLAIVLASSSSMSKSVGSILQNEKRHAIVRFLQGFLALMSFAAYSSSDGTNVGDCKSSSGFVIAIGVLVWLFTWFLCFVLIVSLCSCTSVTSIGGWETCAGTTARFALPIDCLLSFLTAIALCAAAFNHPETNNARGAIAAMYFMFTFLVLTAVVPLRNAMFGGDDIRNSKSIVVEDV